MMRLVSILLLCFITSFCSISCTANAGEESKKNPSPKQAKEKPEPKVHEGDKMAKLFSNFKLKDLKGKELIFGDSLNKKGNSIVLFVKKGCVFCESLLNNLEEEKLGAEVFVVSDKNHGELKAFAEEAKARKKVKAAWLYDFENKFANELEFNSFPRITVLDKSQKVLFYNEGLIMVDNPDSLKNVPFFLALESLAEHTVSKLKKY